MTLRHFFKKLPAGRCGKSVGPSVAKTLTTFSISTSKAAASATIPLIEVPAIISKKLPMGCLECFSIAASTAGRI
jgi:hypothetical protein